MRFNPPPNWPVEPEWTPPPGWQPPAEWGDPPYGWQFWLPTDAGHHVPDTDNSLHPPVPTVVPAEERTSPETSDAPETNGTSETNDAVEAKEEPIRKKGMWARALEHPTWTTLGALVGIIGLVLSVVQLVQAMQTPPADLEVAALSIDGQQSARGTVTGAGTETTRSIALTPIELTLQNKGNKPSLITRIDADIVYFQQLTDCTGEASTPNALAVKYQLAIPMNGAEPAEKHLSSEVRFEVKGGAADRMVLSLGPQTQPAFETRPMVMSAKIKLIHDGDEVLEIGTVSLVTTVGAADAQIDTARWSSLPTAGACAAQNLEYLDKMVAIQATRSRLLDNLRSAYQQVAR
ncbi:hypothetical protein [Mycolicibacterium sp.]|uniref:hypothetical protein n=1 Tax=Mycolicibacterium sp. TaxID=2320850 RepID=UPI0025EA3441|nr:hypothetical protein [Mycolicibacterium sp.]MCB9408865.1 hypothetical protein [Mycolicibacterium sp.]